MEEEKPKGKGQKFVGNIEAKVSKTFPRTKAAMGSLWTIFWVIMAFVVEAIVILVPILLAVAGIVFVIALIVASEGDVDIPIFYGGSKKDKKQL